MLAGLTSAAGRAAIHAVRVQIIPAPWNLAESREILRILQSYGEVTTYRWLKHDALSRAPNSAMAIFADSDAMNRFLRECPLTFEIDRTERQEEDTDFVESSEDVDARGNARYRPVTAHKKGNAAAKKTTYLTRSHLFRINADVWRGKHKNWLERHPFWGPFTRNSKSIVSQDLAKRVPLVGLSDIDANAHKEVPIRILQKRTLESETRLSVRDMIEKVKGKARFADSETATSGSMPRGSWG